MGKLWKKTLYKCITEGLMHVNVWYHGTPGSKSTKFAYMSIGQTHNAAKFRCAPTKSVRDIRCEKICSQKSRPNFTLGHQICYQSIGRTRVSIDRETDRQTGLLR